MTITAGNSGKIIVQVKGVDMKTKVELYQEDGEVYGVFKDKTKKIKVMPDQVKTRLTEVIGGLEEHEIELDEDGEYQIQARKKARLFGFIPVRKRVRFEMNSETGEVIKQRTSWWGFLARDVKEEIVGGCGTVTPGREDECCQNKGFDSWDSESLECESCPQLTSPLKRDGCTYPPVYDSDNRCVTGYNEVCETSASIDEIVENEKVICGGWDTFEETICECDGEYEKPSCPENTECDSISYYCNGTCGECVTTQG